MNRPNIIIGVAPVGKPMLENCSLGRVYGTVGYNMNQRIYICFFY